MKDVRELLARFHASSFRLDAGTGTGGGVDALTNIDIAGALGMVQAGLGRDLMELLYGPAPTKADVVRALEGVTRLAMEERNRRSKDYADVRTTWGIAECMAKFQRDRDEGTMRALAILKARVAMKRDLLMPEKMDERLPEIIAVAVGYLKGERLSNRERALALGVGESTYREVWAELVDWLITKLVEHEQRAAEQFRRALSAGSDSFGNNAARRA